MFLFEALRDAMVPLWAAAVTWDARISRQDAQWLQYYRDNQKSKTLIRGLIRRGIPDTLRTLIWAELIDGSGGVHEANDMLDRYNRARERTFGACIPEEMTNYPMFGMCWRTNLDQPTLAVKRVLAVLAHEQAHLDYCPMLPALVHLLSAHLREEHVLYHFMDTFIAKRQPQQRAHDGWGFIPMHRRDLLIFERLFEGLLERTAAFLWRHVCMLRVKHPEYRPPWTQLLSGLFMGIYPLAIISCIVDAFLSEGFKVIVRFALAHLLLRANGIKQARDPDALNAAILDPADQGSTQRLTHTAFETIHFSRQIIQQYRTRHRKVSIEDFDEHDRQILMQQVCHVPHLIQQSHIAPEGSVWEFIWSIIPTRFRVLRADLLFCTQEHGYNLKTLYLRASLREPLLLLIETTGGDRVGAYLSRSFVCRLREPVYGTGETFLLKLSHRQDTSGMELKAYFWETDRSNEAFITANDAFIAVGCSGSSFGLWLDKDMHMVSSSASETFGNEPLFGDSRNRVIKSLEVWTFVI